MKANILFVFFASLYPTQFIFILACAFTTARIRFRGLFVYMRPVNWSHHSALATLDSSVCYLDNRGCMRMELAGHAYVTQFISSLFISAFILCRCVCRSYYFRHLMSLFLFLVEARHLLRVALSSSRMKAGRKIRIFMLFSFSIVDSKNKIIHFVYLECGCADGTATAGGAIEYFNGTAIPFCACEKNIADSEITIRFSFLSCLLIISL